VNGRLFTPGRWDELASILAELVSSAKERERLGAAAADLAAEYTIDRVIGPMAAAFEGIGNEA
jgi:hypothetical protein